MSEQSSPIFLQLTVYPGLQSAVPSCRAPDYPNHRHTYDLPGNKNTQKQKFYVKNVYLVAKKYLLRLKNICDVAGGPDGLAGDDEPAGGGPPVLGLGLRVAAQAELHSQPQEADRGPASAGQDGGQ